MALFNFGAKVREKEKKWQANPLSSMQAPATRIAQTRANAPSPIEFAKSISSQSGILPTNPTIAPSFQRAVRETGRDVQAIGQGVLDVIRSPQRAAVSIGLDLLSNKPQTFTPQSLPARAFFGNRPIRPVTGQVQQTAQDIQQFVAPRGTTQGKIGSFAAAVPLAIGASLLDVTPMGGARKQAAEAGVDVLRQATRRQAPDLLADIQRVRPTQLVEDITLRAPIGKPPKSVPDMAGNIRLDKFDIPKEGRDELRRIITENQDFIGQTRTGRQSVQETQRLANEILSLNPQKGKALNAQELKALGDTVASLERQTSDLAQRLMTPDGDTLINRASLAAKQAELASVLASYAGAREQAGRALNILKQTNRAIRSGDPDLIRQALKFDEKINIEDFAKRLVELGDDPIAKMNLVRSAYKPGFSDYFGWYWYSNILSGPLTQIRNIAGNVSNLAFDVGSTPFAAAWDVAKRGTKGVGSREVFLGELPQQLVGSWSGMKTGLEKGMFLLKNGYSIDTVTGLDVRPPEAIPGLLPNIVGRGLGFFDEIFKGITFQRAIQAGAYKRVKNKGLSGKAFNDAFQDMLKSPPQGLMKEAADAATRSVFQDELGVIGKALESVRKDIVWSPNGKTQYRIFNPVRFVIPFVRTVANIMKQSVEATPAGFLQSQAGRSARQIAQARGRTLLGSTLGLYFASLASEGRISGTGPNDPKMREALMDSGWQPNSIKIGDTWHNYQAFQPLGLTLALIGNAHDAYVYDKDEASVASVAGRMANTVLDQSFLTGTFALVEALQDPERFGKKFVAQNLQGLIPGSGLLGQVTRATDKTVRATDTLSDIVQSGIPGLSSGLPARRSVLGEPLTRPGTTINLLFNPLRSSKERESLLKELADQGVELTTHSRTMTIGNEKRKMSDELYSEYTLLTGTAKRDALELLIRHRAWPSLSQEQKQEAIDEVEDRVRNRVSDIIRPNVELEALGLPLLVKANDPRIEIIQQLLDDDRYLDADESVKIRIMREALKK